MLGLVLRCCGAHRFDVEANTPIVARTLQNPDRIEGTSQVHRPERLVLVVLQAVLVVEVNAPQLVVP